MTTFRSVLKYRTASGTLGDSPVPSRIIAVELSGGLGSQLFQYAAGLSLARRHNAQIVLDTSVFRRRREPNSTALAPFVPEAAVSFDRARFSPDGNTASVTVQGPAPGPRVATLSVFREASYDYDPRFDDLGPNVLLSGGWQSYRYFENVLSDLRAAANVVAAGLDARNRELLSQIRSKPSVSVHVRRGDRLREPHRSLHGVCDLTYYRNNIDRLREAKPDCGFYIFSDDPAWCEAALGDRSSIVVAHNGPDQAHVDLVLMAACQDHILSNSSLGWWAAYLSERRRQPAIAPVPWFPKRSATPDLFPPQWELRSRATSEPLSVVNEQVARTRISVVVPARDRPAMLKEAIESVVRQTKPADEVIIVLSDASAECTALAHDLAHRKGTSVVAIPEASLAKARNAGVRVATGDWIAFLDDDDIWLPQKLERQLTAALLLDVGAVSCDFTLFNKSGDLVDSGLSRVPPGLSLKEALILGNYVSGGSAAILRADVLKRVGGFDERMTACEDTDLWRRVSWESEIVVLWDRLVRIRRHEGQMSGNKTLMRNAHRFLFAKMCIDTPRELRHMLFPVGLLSRQLGGSPAVRDFIKTLPEFLANPIAGARRLIFVAARLKVRQLLGPRVVSIIQRWR